MSRRRFSRDETLSPELLSAFDDYLRSELEGDYDDFMGHEPAPEFVRVNPLRAEPTQVLDALRSHGLEAHSHPAIAGAICVRRPKESTDPCGFLDHFAGHYVKQSLGSMIPAALLDAQAGEQVLDLCAAPGSKSTQLAAAMGEQGELWVNDLAGMRMNPLAARLDACGAANVLMLNQPGERLASTLWQSFDRVLVDAPCSGLGDVANLPQIRDRFAHRKSAVTLSSLQYRLLVGALRLVRVGGRVVYSTCSLTVEENEAVLSPILDRFPVRLVPLPRLEGLVIREARLYHHGAPLNPALRLAGRIQPWENPTEGFFVAVLEKTAPLAQRFQRLVTADALPMTETLAFDHPEILPGLRAIAQSYGLALEQLAGLRFWTHKDRLYFFAPQIQSFWQGGHRAGLPLGRWRQGMLRLSHTAVQRFGAQLERNVVEVNTTQMQALAETGYCDFDASRIASPYPVLSYPPFGPLMTVAWTGSGLRWKRARAFVL
ncbi:MAG: RsmB/NOP family class I SAM-dependent RNA methyltransferase [Myxococcota bacterium]|jgi:16S rRNA (cytosine1407-C5)-methyltransferase|nr:RsmB/NOP family class I SAM-dependent RNA methyltransferase [Myxococcota bacterium]